MICKNCNTQNMDDAKFCFQCGAALNDNASAQSNEPNQYSQQPQYGQQPLYSQQPVEEPGKGLAIASMVLGIISFFCFSLITGILAIIFGAVAKSKNYRGGMATAGIVCGVISLVLYFLILVMWGSAFYALF